MLAACKWVDEIGAGPGRGEGRSALGCWEWVSSSWPGLLDARARGTHMCEGVSGVGGSRVRPLESQSGASCTAKMQWSLLRGGTREASTLGNGSVSQEAVTMAMTLCGAGEVG